MQTQTFSSQEIRTAIEHADETKAKLETYLKAGGEKAKTDAEAAIAKLQYAMKRAKDAIQGAVKDALDG